MMEKKTTWRFLSLLLALVLTASCFAAPTLASENESGTPEETVMVEEESSAVEETTVAEETEAASEETTAEEPTEMETEAEEETEASEIAAEETVAAETEAPETEAVETEAQETAAEETTEAADEVAAVKVPGEYTTDDGKALTIPANLKVTANNNYSLVVSWDAVEGAASYVVYKHNGKKWVKLGTPTTNTFTDPTTDMTVGTSCKYTVTAVGTVSGKTAETAYNTTGVTGVVCPPQPKYKGTLSRGKNKLELRWEEVEGATGYAVYRKGDDGKWGKSISGTITANHFVDSTVTFGKEYTYAVLACVKSGSKTYWSFYAAGALTLDAKDVQTIKGKTVAKEQVSLPQTKMVSAKGVAYKSITVTWEQVEGADGYVVYRRTSSGKWKKRKTVTGGETLTWTDKKCSYYKPYYFTVRAYINYDGEQQKCATWDNKGVKGRSILAVPEKQAAQGAGLKAIKVSWAKVKGAKGYYIYRKSKKTGKWKKIGQTGWRTLTYTDRTIKEDKDYYYSVRAWRKYGKKKIKGLYDNDGVKGSPSIKKKMKDGLQLYYNEKGNLITDVENIIGKRSSYKLEVDYSKNIVTVYAKGDNGTYNLPVKAFCCSTGEATPIGTFYTPAKYRWHELNGKLYGQWCTRIHGGVLFHSVYYYSYNNANDLSTSAYNKLGTKCSHGCVRLCCRDAKWIYDNCRLGTTVVIKNGCKNPFGKPTPLKVRSSHTWDPTDPNMYYKCQKEGCH